MIKFEIGDIVKNLKGEMGVIVDVDGAEYSFPVYCVFKLKNGRRRHEMYTVDGKADLLDDGPSIRLWEPYKDKKGNRDE